MKVPSFRRLTPDDYTMFRGEEGERFLEQLNNAIEIVTTALQNRLTYEDNFHAEVKRFKLEHSTEVEVTLERLRSRVIDIQVLNPELYDYVKVAWEHMNRNTVRLKISFDSAPTDAVEVSLLFLGE